MVKQKKETGTDLEVQMMENHPKVAEIKTTIATLQDKALDCAVIESDDELEAAVALLVDTKSLLKDADTTRDVFAKPYFNKYKAIRNVFAVLVNPLTEIKETLEVPIRVYRAKQLAEQQALEDENEAKQVEMDSLAAELGEDAPLPAPIEPVGDAINKTMETLGGGKLHARENWTYDKENVDLSKVPKEYLTVALDHKKVMAAIKSGTKKIPGIDIRNEEIFAGGRSR